MDNEDNADDPQVETQSGRSSAYTCTYPGCGKNYSRASHLARHRQSHQDTKQHHCDVCGKSFMRQDVLVRHRKRQHAPKSEGTSRGPEEIDEESDTDARFVQSVTVAEALPTSSSSKLEDSRSIEQDTLSQNDLSKILLASASAPGHTPYTTDSVFHRTSGAQHDLPTSSGIVLPSSSYTWQGSSLDLDSLLFSTTAGNATSFTPAQTGASDDFNSMFAAWTAPVQPVPGNGSHISSTNTLQWPGQDNPNDDFMRWLNGDLGIPDVPPVEPNATNTTSALTSSTGFPNAASEDANSSSIQIQRKQPSIVPTLQHGLRTRPPSPVFPSNTENESQWPMSWEPNRQEHDAGLSSNIMEFSEVQDIPSLVESQGIPMDESCRLAILELLHFADIPAHAYHRLYVRLSKIPLSAFNSWLAIYFQEIHPYMPFLHKASFDPRKKSGFLLTIMVAIGAQLSNIPGARSVSHFLGDLVHSAFSKVVDADRILTRELKMMQTLVIWSLLRYNGLRRLMEMAEVFRAPYAVSLGRLHAFDDKIKLPVEVNDDTVALDRRWRLWRTWEARRRTGLASFLSEAEFTVLLNRPPMIVPRELRGRLPCSDEVWNASTPSEWHQLYTIESLLSHAYSISDVVDCRPSALRELARHARSTAFGTTCLIQMLHVNIWTVRQCGNSNSPFTRTMLQEIQRALIIIACSDNEFTPYQKDGSSAWRGVAILYHFAQMASRIPVPTLLALAGKESSQEADEAAAYLKEWLANSPASGREVALHAGQCWRILGTGSLRGTYEPFCFLYSALVLYICAVSSHITRADEMEMHTPIGIGEEDFILLDCNKPGAIELNFVQTGLAAVKIEDIRLGSPAAGQEILSRAKAFMDRNDAWGLTTGLSRLLQEVRDRATNL